MAKKLKKRDLFRRERSRIVSRRIDVIFAALAVVVVLSMLVCRDGVGISDVGRRMVIGFPAWFLLFLGYLPLLIWSAVSAVFSIGTDFLTGHEVLALGICDLTSLALVWAAVRLSGRRYGADFLQIAGNFALMLLVWGIFQLVCGLTVMLWGRGGFASLHSHLNRPVEVVRQVSEGELSQSEVK